MNYWLVGAKLGGQKEVLDIFLKRGYWYCWDVSEEDLSKESFKGGNAVSRQLESFKNIEINDRIAVKRLCGQGSKDMRILALGIVKDICQEEHRVYVNWIAVSDEIANNRNFENLPNIYFKERKVDLGGCISSIHGPYTLDSDIDKRWLQEIFFI